MKIILQAISVAAVVVCAQASAQTAVYNRFTLGATYYNPGVATTVVFDDVPIPTARLGTSTGLAVSRVTVGIFRAPLAPATSVDLYQTTMTTTATPPDTPVDTPPGLIGTVALPANGGAAVTTQVTLGDGVNTLFQVPLNMSLFAGFGTFSIGVRLSSINANQGWRTATGPDANSDVFWQYDPNVVPPESTWWWSGNPVAAFCIRIEGTPVSMGACCQTNGVCSVTGQAACAAPQTWLGEGTRCTPTNSCPQPGACCVAATGVCYMSTVIAPGSCSAGDTYWGDNSTCTPNNPCPQPPTGACCYPNGTCAVTTAAACPGAWLGAATLCNPTNRCQWPGAGACCYGNGSCNVTMQAACEASGGVWLGSTTNCSPNPCQSGSGSIVGWGDNLWGQLNVPPPNSDFVSVAAGFAYGLGLKTDDSIVGWGQDSYGQLDVPSPNNSFVAVAASTDGAHSLGLKANGSIVAWGYNTSGQCNVPAQNAGFRAVAAGAIHSLGLKANGSIVAWGWNGWGECNVPYPNTDFVAIAAGGTAVSGGHSLGLKADGSIAAWGRNDYGQCDVPPPNSNFVAVAAGAAISLALKSDGSLVAWGEVSGVPDTGFVAVAAGWYQDLALRANGSILAWGGNDYGQCNVPEPNTGFVTAGGGRWHSLGLRNPQVLGACCKSGGPCVVTTQAACSAIGTWQGAGTTCTPNPCEQTGPGACCFAGDTCIFTTQAACTGNWLGAGTLCRPNPCFDLAEPPQSYPPGGQDGLHPPGDSDTDRLRVHAP